MLAVYGIHQVCLHESAGTAAIGVAAGAFPVGLIQPRNAPSSTEG